MPRGIRKNVSPDRIVPNDYDYQCILNDKHLVFVQELIDRLENALAHFEQEYRTKLRLSDVTSTRLHKGLVALRDDLMAQIRTYSPPDGRV